MPNALQRTRQILAKRRVGAGSSIPYINTIAFTGDSISNGGGFAKVYQLIRTDKTWRLYTANSRAVGGLERLNDGSNYLMGFLNQIAVNSNAELAGGMIGANDMALTETWPQHKAKLIEYYKQLKKHNPNLLVYWCPTLPFSTGHATFSTQLAKQQASVADGRDPAQWSQWCDFMIPIGADPHWLEADTQKYFGTGDYVHPNWWGQEFLRNSWRAGIETLLDYSNRAGSTKVYSNNWLPDMLEIQDLNTPIERIQYLSGLEPKGVYGTITVSGFDAQFRIGQGSYTTSYTGWIYNGDQVAVKVTSPSTYATDRDITLTINGDSKTIKYRTIANGNFLARWAPQENSSPNAYVYNMGRTGSVGGFTSQNPVRLKGDTLLTNPTGYVEYTIKYGELNVSRVFRYGLMSSAANLGTNALHLGGQTGEFGISRGNQYVAGTLTQFSGPLNNNQPYYDSNGATVGLLVYKATGRAWLRTNTGWYPDTPTFNPDGSLATGTGINTGLTEFYFGGSVADQSSLTINAGQVPFVHDAAIPANVIKGWA